MKRIERSALVPFSSEQMFALVNDIEQYAEFVPYCHGTQVISRTDQEVIATIEVAKAGLAKSFTTRNVLHPHEKIELHLEKGPFRELEGQWNFLALGDDACKIELKLQFEFQSALAGIAFGAVFQQLAEAMVRAFTERAKEVYA